MSNVRRHSPAVMSEFAVDRNGVPVAVGTVVRVVAISSSVLERLEHSERERVQSMLGETFPVYEIDAWGSAWVQKWWRHSDSESTSHSLALRSGEMEVAPNVGV